MGIHSRQARGADTRVCGLETHLEALSTEHRDESRCGSLKAAPRERYCIGSLGQRLSQRLSLSADKAGRRGRLLPTVAVQLESAI